MWIRFKQTSLLLSLLMFLGLPLRADFALPDSSSTLSSTSGTDVIYNVELAYGLFLTGTSNDRLHIIRFFGPGQANEVFLSSGGTTIGYGFTLASTAPQTMIWGIVGGVMPASGNNDAAFWMFDALPNNINIASTITFNNGTDSETVLALMNAGAGDNIWATGFKNNDMALWRYNLTNSSPSLSLTSYSTFDSGGIDKGRAIVTTPCGTNGTTWVAGEANGDLALWRFRGFDGVLLSTTTLDSGGYDAGFGLDRDGCNPVIVGTFNKDFALWRFDSSGVLTSSTVVVGSGDEVGYDVDVGPSSIFAVGKTTNTVNSDFVIWQFSLEGVFISSRVYNSGSNSKDNDIGYSLTVQSETPSIFVTGQIGGTNNNPDSAMWEFFRLAPSTPTATSPTASTTSLRWAWSDLGDETTYYVYASTFGSPLATLSRNTTNWLEIGLSTNTEFTRKIVAKNEIGNSTATFASYTLAAVPSQAAISNVFSSSFAFSWNANTNPSGTRYEVSLSTDNFATNFSTPIPLSANFRDNTTTFASLTPGFPYSLRVRAYNGEDTPTAFTGSVSTYTATWLPTNFSIVSVDSQTVSFSWSASSNTQETTYRLEYWLASGATSYVTTTLTTHTLSGLSQGKPYYFRITALNQGGELGSFSSTLSTTTLAKASAAPSQSQTLTYELPSGEARLNLEPETFTETVSITIRESPHCPTASMPSANMRLTNIGIDVSLDSTLQPTKDITLTLNYRDSDVSGFDENRLVIARCDTTANVWVPLTSTPYPQTNQITTRTQHLSLFEILEVQTAANLDNAVIFPNPARPSRGEIVNFSNLPPQSSIKIFTASGEFIKSLEINNAGLAQWNTKNENNETVASGVYVALIDKDGNRRILKVAIER